MYVDDLTSGAEDVGSAYNFYIKAKLCLAEVSFNLRKIDSNSQDLRQMNTGNKQPLCHDASATNSRSQMKDSHETT